jgi:hypothetical protein
MRTDLALALALTFAAACTTTASPAPVQPVPENKCAHVADHLLSLLTASAKEAPGEELDRVRNVFHSRCRDDGWSAQAQQCFLALTAKEEVDRCAAQLTDAQRSALEQGPPEPS